MLNAPLQCCKLATHCDYAAMNSAEHGLEQALLKLPTLKHIGMALVQFAYRIGYSTDVRKDANGVFRLQFVGFSFPEGDERIRLHVEVEIRTIEKMDLRWLPLQAEAGSQICEIKHAGQLACAARYIEHAHGRYLGTRQTTSFDPTTN